LAGNSQKTELVREIEESLRTVRPKSGQKAVGYFCSYVPPEILLAAGIHPLRLSGLDVSDSSSGDAYLSHLTCSFARSITAGVLDGAFDFLYGQVAVNTCDHVRRANDVIIAKSNLDFHGFITVPRSLRESLLTWYLEELERLQAALEDHFKVKITDQALRDAIAKMNAVRERIHVLDLLRRDAQPRLSGSEMLAATVAARMLAPEEFVKIANQLIDLVKRSEPIQNIRCRVLLIGGPLDDPRFVRAIESQGAHIAGDMFCFGARGLGNMIEAGEKPLESLARAYLHQIPCARMTGEFPGRYQSLLDLYRDCRAQGIIFQRIKFCQIWSSEVHNLRHRLEKNPLPLLVLDREYGTVSTGQIKTRVQGFVESLEGQVK
jgi:benzoyl-CoA reductase subunit C